MDCGTKAAMTMLYCQDENSEVAVLCDDRLHVRCLLYNFSSLFNFGSSHVISHLAPVDVKFIR